MWSLIRLKNGTNIIILDNSIKEVQGIENVHKINGVNVACTIFIKNQTLEYLKNVLKNEDIYIMNDISIDLNFSKPIRELKRDLENLKTEKDNDRQQFQRQGDERLIGNKIEEDETKFKLDKLSHKELKKGDRHQIKIENKIIIENEVEEQEIENGLDKHQVESGLDAQQVENGYDEQVEIQRNDYEIKNELDNEGEIDDVSISDDESCYNLDNSTIESSDSEISDDEYASDDSFTNEQIRNAEQSIPLPELSNEQIRNVEQSVPLPELSISNLFDSVPSTSKDNFASSSLIESPNSSAKDKEKDPDYVVENGDTVSDDPKNEENNSKNEQLNSSNFILKIPNSDNENIPNYETIVIKRNDGSSKDGPRIRKKHLCKFCNKDQTHLKRHLLRKHQNEKEVQDMKRNTDRNTGTRLPMKKLLHAGDAKSNTNANLFIGEFRVARIPQKKDKIVEDYVICPACEGTFAEENFKFHFKLCTGASGKSSRYFKVAGRMMLPSFHPSAGKKMRTQILCKMRNDSILRTIRYDELLIEFGNEICHHLRGEQHKANICNKLRRLGRLKKEMNVKNFSDMIVSTKSLSVVNAIEKMAKDPEDPDSEFLKYPTLAENLATLVKQVCSTYSIMCIRNDQFEVNKTVKNFLKCFTNDYNKRLSRVVSESHKKFKRQKKEVLPSISDINLLYTYLSDLRKQYYNALQKAYSEDIHLKLLKTTLTSLQIFNRRRPGDVERIFLDDYQGKQRIDKTQMKEYYQLPEDLKDLAKEFTLMHARGKWANDIKLLIPPDVKLCLDTIVNLRDRLDISPKNTYLFALPRTLLYSIRHPSAYVLLSKYAEECGAVEPKLLRATNLRKHLATRCIELNLNDAELLDLAGYMGHHVNIHKSHYRKNIVDRDIPIFLKFVNAAMNIEGTDQKCASKIIESEPDNDNSELENLSVENSSHSKSSQLLPKTKKARWTEVEKQIAQKYFSNYLNGTKKDCNPTNEEIRKMQNENPEHFIDRNVKSIRTWLHTQAKKSYD